MWFRTILGSGVCDPYTLTSLLFLLAVPSFLVLPSVFALASTLGISLTWAGAFYSLWFFFYLHLMLE